MVFDFRDGRKRDFHYLTISAFHLHAGSGECLSGFHAANDAPHTLTIHRYNFNIALAVKRLKGSKCLGNFHVMPPGSTPIAVNSTKDFAPTMTDVQVG
jgi:hypothetical protein